jgi:hypothetical protein
MRTGRWLLGITASALGARSAQRADWGRRRNSALPPGKMAVTRSRLPSRTAPESGACSGIATAIALAREQRRNTVRIDTPLIATAQNFALSISEKITATVTETKSVGCIILAQTSTAVAEPLLKDAGVPVYSSPRLAVKETMRVAQLG